LLNYFNLHFCLICVGLVVVFVHQITDLTVTRIWIFKLQPKTTEDVIMGSGYIGNQSESINPWYACECRTPNGQYYIDLNWANWPSPHMASTLHFLLGLRVKDIRGGWIVFFQVLLNFLKQSVCLFGQAVLDMVESKIQRKWWTHDFYMETSSPTEVKTTTYHL